MNRLSRIRDSDREVLTGPTWMTHALCRRFPSERHLWFPDSEHPARTTEAQQVCGWCPVRAACLAYALELPRNPHGVWGGTTTRQRRRLRSQRQSTGQRNGQHTHRVA